MYVCMHAYELRSKFSKKLLRLKIAYYNIKISNNSNNQIQYINIYFLIKTKLKTLRKKKGKKEQT